MKRTVIYLLLAALVLGANIGPTFADVTQSISGHGTGCGLTVRHAAPQWFYDPLEDKIGVMLSDSTTLICPDDILQEIELWLAMPGK